MKLTVKAHRAQIHKRIRKKIMGTAERPRLSVFRSSKGIYCQIIDDIAGHTLAAATHKESEKAAKTVQAQTVGTLIAEKAKAVGVVKVVFDRGGFLYHGRVKALAEAARAGGLEF